MIILGVDACIACEAGKYGPNKGSSNCINFPAGTFFAGTGATSIDSGSKCPRGFYSEAGAKNCNACPAGYFGEEQGGTSKGEACKKCDKGEYNRKAGQESCKTCTVGQASPPSTPPGAPPVNPCVECVNGQYQDLTQATSYGCKYCAPGKFYSVSEIISYFSFDGVSKFCS